MCSCLQLLRHDEHLVEGHPQVILYYKAASLSEFDPSILVRGGLGLFDISIIVKGFVQRREVLCQSCVSTTTYLL